MRTIYFDYNATTPMHEVVTLCVLETMKNPHNASSLHAQGQKARQILENARIIIKKSINAPIDSQVIFAASGTEANNLVIRSQQQCIISAIEHKSILNSVLNPIIIPVNKQGLINLDNLQQTLEALEKTKDTPILVSIMLANNETGVIQPIKEVAKIAHKYSCIVHTDAAQAFGKIPVDMQDLEVDLITISAHKFGGPLGTAAVIFKDKIQLKPIIFGGGQEQGLRSGTENIPAIAGMSKAVEQISSTVESVQKTMVLRDRIEKYIKRIVPEAEIFDQNAPRLPNTSYIATPQILNTTQLISLGLRNICVGTAAACSSMQDGISHVLSAMKVKESIARCAIRISLGWDNTEEEVDIFLDTWSDLYNRSNGLKLD
jgi:cysteine desulfurase